MRVATWNINGLRARLDFIKIWLDSRQPDLVGFQELKLSDHEFPDDVFSELGYHTAFNSQKAWNGVAIVSRQPIEDVSKDLSGHEDQGARLITGLVDDLSFTTVYVPNGKDVDHGDFPEKLKWLD
ncbi:MAG: endonuclease/exonuclease/phosphatase family protein, partial [Pseudomonadales bacterium]|nr:endonuclease/exonuclease/phosphatase family protein [Pseudomonadales bacterium]